MSDEDLGEHRLKWDSVGSVVLVEGADTRMFVWAPQEDIDAYELAMCLPLILSARPGTTYDTLPERCQRHFRVIERKR